MQQYGDGRAHAHRIDRARDNDSDLFSPVTDRMIARVAGKPPVTGAWLVGDPPGRRQFVHVGKQDLEFGGHLDCVRVAYETWGEPNADRSNAVLVLHALTGDSHVAGVRELGHHTAGWWADQIGPGRPIDTDRFYVVCANVLGGCQGTTGPSTMRPSGQPWGSQFPYVSIRDIVHASHNFSTTLGIDRWHTVIGPSMGGMQALEWAIMYPDDVERLVVIAAPAVTSADRIAVNSVQVDMIRSDPDYLGGDYYDLPEGRGPWHSLALARRVAVTSYRSAEEFNTRFGRSAQSGVSPLGKGGRFAIESYLDFHGNKFTRRFDANTYITMLEAMNSHDIGRDRGGVVEALGSITAKSLVVGIDSDRLYGIDEQHAIVAGLRTHIAGDEAVVVHSPYGHDSFLIEREAIGAQLERILAA